MRLFSLIDFQLSTCTGAEIFFVEPSGNISSLYASLPYGRRSIELLSTTSLQGHETNPDSIEIYTHPIQHFDMTISQKLCRLQMDILAIPVGDVTININNYSTEDMLWIHHYYVGGSAYATRMMKEATMSRELVISGRPS